ncbi:MAG: two-component regulator propeller domain-containing protein [Chitinophagaceae bacterium]
MTLHIKLLLTGQIFLTLSCLAQYKFEKAVSLNKDNGFPVNTMRSIARDEDGFMWVGTTGGLCRFDGLQVKIFQEGEDLEHSLFDNNVFVVLPVKDKIWLGTDQGISVMDRKHFTFRHYQFEGRKKADSLKRRFDQSISCIYQDQKGRIWIGTRERGVALYMEAKDEFRFFTYPENIFPPLTPTLGSGYSILSITASSKNDSVIWAGTAGGLQQINSVTGETRLITFPRASKDYQTALNAFRRLYHHTDGLLYVGSWAAGLNVYDPATGSFSPLVVKSDAGKQITRSVIAYITPHSDHEFWISALTGLALYDTRLKDVTWYKFNNPNKNEIYAIQYIDQSNRVWLTTGSGLSYFDPSLQQFATYSYAEQTEIPWSFSYNVLTEPTANRITVCPRTTDGIFFFDRRKGEWSKSLFPKLQSFHNEGRVVKGFLQLADDLYVIASDQGIFRYWSRKRKLEPVNLGPVFTPSWRGDILKDRHGNVWLSDDNWGLTKWNPKTDQYVNYREQTIGGDSVGKINWLVNLYEDSRGNIWFQRQGGIGVYWAERDSFLKFTYLRNEKKSFPSVASFAEDRKGRVWANTRDGWIGYALAVDPSAGLILKLNTREKGLMANIQKLAADTAGNIWGFTSKEVARINPDDFSLTSYSLQYGVGEAEFYHFSFLSTGEMLFGGKSSITIANPAELKRNQEIPEPYISEIQVQNRPYQLYVPGQSMRLKAEQNFFSIGFSARAYTMPKEVKFRYRLKGFDEWSEPTDRRFANYTNVPGGWYVFQLQAANNEGVWNNQILELPIRVATPLGELWWFRLGLALLMGGVVYAIYRYRVNQFRKKEKLKSEYEKKIANVEMSSLLAQMNPHFLFNSLNSIDSYIIRNESGKASEYLNSFARLMRLILQNSRSNYITLKDELEALELYMQMEELRFRNKFEYVIKVSDGLDTSAVVIPPMLIQPYVENAIWHGLMHKDDGTKGMVEIIISGDDHKLTCVIQDNGIGRAKAEEIKAAKSGNRKRSMGMQITNDRIDMINKLYGSNTKVEIRDLCDKEGKPAGTRVELTITV